jgi:hypothetical protein
MRIVCHLVLLLFIQCRVPKQQAVRYFTGELEYAYTYSSPTLNTDSLSRVRPHKSRFIYGRDNYQSCFYGKDTVLYHYSGLTGKAISKNGVSWGGDCDDYTAVTDSVYWYKIYDTDEKIMGEYCRVLEFQSKIFTTKYYISRRLKIAPGTYNRHVSYNWKFYGETGGGGLILRIEHRFKNFVMKGEITRLRQTTSALKELEAGETALRQICGGN